MAYVAVSDSNLEVGDPIRSTDITQMNDNIIDHESRILALEDASTRIASHFSELYPTQVGTSIIASAAVEDDYNDWVFESSTANVQLKQGIWRGIDEHQIEFDAAGAGAAEYASLWGKTGFYYDNRTKPIVGTFRFKINDTTATGWDDFWIGLGGTNTSGVGTGAAGQPVNGIFLMRSSATQWLVRARRNSVNTDAAAWTHGLDDTWVEVIITWVAASKTATITVNGTQRGQFTSADNIPSDRVVYPFAKAEGPNDAGDYMYIDRIEVYASGPVADLA